MANAFSKEERVFFANLGPAFEDDLVFSDHVEHYNVPGRQLEQAGDTVWRPIPYIMQSFSGLDQSSNFGDVTQLSVPASLSTIQSSPFTLTKLQRRDPQQLERLAMAAKQKLSSWVNQQIIQTAALQGTVVYKSGAVAGGYDDISACSAAFDEVGVGQDARTYVSATRNYNSMASNLASRAYLTQGGKAQTAYERSYIGPVAGFDTFKTGSFYTLAAKAGSSVTVNGANQYHTPAATSGGSNVDNRYQNLAITVGSGTVAAGDCFTIAGVNKCHLISKVDTGQLQTFRIISIVSGGGGTGTVKISPAIVSNGGSTAAEAMYKNVTATPANGAAITFLNTVAKPVDVFWHKDAIEILPAAAIAPTEGQEVLSYTTEKGLTITFEKQHNIRTGVTDYRLDVLAGFVVKAPQMCGIALYSQT